MRRVEHLLRATARAETRHFWFRGFRAFVTPLLQRRPPEVTDARLLDCGCGTGANVDLLGAFGRAYGFDLTEVGLRIGREAGRTRLARATVTAAPFPTASFHIVTSFDVLYSLADPDEEAADRRNVPAAEARRVRDRQRRGDAGPARRSFGAEPRGPAIQPQRLRSRMVRAGFPIERLTYTNATLFPPLRDRAADSAPARTRGAKSEAESEISVPPEPINAIMTAVMRLEALWLRAFDAPFGSSLLCLARKPAS